MLREEEQSPCERVGGGQVSRPVQKRDMADQLLVGHPVALFVGPNQQRQDVVGRLGILAAQADHLAHVDLEFVGELEQARRSGR